MFGVIALIGPSVIGLKVLEHLLNGLSKKNIFYYFTILLTISVIINNSISYSLFNITDVFYHLNNFPIYLAKYVLISIIINIVLALILSIIIKSVRLKIEVEKIENIKKKTKSTKKAKNK